MVERELIGGQDNMKGHFIVLYRGIVTRVHLLNSKISSSIPHCDMNNCYYSITPNHLNKALLLSRYLTKITPLEINIIFNALKP